MVTKEISDLGWEAEVSQLPGGRHSARASREGHVCFAKDGTDLGALLRLKRSILEVENDMGPLPGQVVRLAEPVGDIEAGLYVVMAAGDDTLTVSPLGEGPETGDLCRAGEAFGFPRDDTTRLKVVPDIRVSRP